MELAVAARQPGAGRRFPHLVRPLAPPGRLRPGFAVVPAWRAAPQKPVTWDSPRDNALSTTWARVPTPSFWRTVLP